MPYYFKVMIPGQWLNSSVMYKSTQTKTKLWLGFYEDRQKGDIWKLNLYVSMLENYCKQPSTETEQRERWTGGAQRIFRAVKLLCVILQSLLQTHRTCSPKQEHKGNIGRELGAKEASDGGVINCNNVSLGHRRLTAGEGYTTWGQTVVATFWIFHLIRRGSQNCS